MKSLKVRVKLSYLDKLKLNTLSNEHRVLYNFLLENAKHGINFKDLHYLSKNFKHSNNLTINAKSVQNTSRMLINNIKSFYALRKKNPDKNPKFPYKFKSWKYFTSFMYDFNNGCGGFKVKNNILYIQKKLLQIQLPEICKTLTKNIKTITFKKEDNKYFIIFVYAENKKHMDLNRDNFLSLDLGLTQIFAAYNSTGYNFSIQNKQFKKLEKQIKFIQSNLDHKQKNSKYWKKFKHRFNRLSKKLSNKNKDFQHKLSKSVIDYCKENDIGTLIVGDIKTSKLIIKYNKGLNKSTQGRGTLSRFKTFLEYKAKNEEMDFYKVNEAYTSQNNCITGKREFSSNLSIREVEILPNIKIDRDLNSAINIAKKVKGKWLPHFEDLNFNLHKMYMNDHSMIHECTRNIYKFL